MTSPRVFTIPASAPFLPTLVAALADGRVVGGFDARDPLTFADATLYLPTRAACRLAREAFLETLKHDAVILPRIIALGGVDEDEIGFTEPTAGESAAAGFDLPPALEGFERNILLARLILKWANSETIRRAGSAPLVANNPATAFALAGDLARLMDDMTIRRGPWDRLEDLVPDDLDEYWQHTLEFLIIAREWWPKELEERGAIEPADRRGRLIEAEAARLKRINAPVIAAGSTGSIPTTAVLLETIAKLPHGAVVLPGLDTDLDVAAWDLIENDTESAPGHPQFAMRALLRRIGIAREAVVALAPPAPHGRELLVSEAMRPANASGRWHERLTDVNFVRHAEAALAGVGVIEAGNAEEEALAIAVVLREAVEEQNKTAALVTPDRALARRVIAALARWNISADDSKDDDLAATPAGVVARLVAEVVLGGLAPVPLLALLKSPLCNLDSHAVATLERAILRGPRPKPGTAGLAQALTTFRQSREKLHRTDPRKTITDAELSAADRLVMQLAAALGPLERLDARPRAFVEIATLHRTAVNVLGRESFALSDIFDEIARIGVLDVEPRDYAELFQSALAGETAGHPPTNARVKLLGTLESRLQNVDRMVLGSLVEDVWPPQTRADPWLSRPMRQALGLDLPERRIGLSAHDFAQGLGSREVFLTRAGKRGGAPTVASRFMQRLEAVAGPERWTAARERGDKYLAWARALDRPTEVKPITRPAPKPPIEARPKQLSVTAIEDWLRDPYTIYAKHILRLIPLDAIDTPPGAADRGSVIHEAIGKFTKDFAEALPSDPAGALIDIARAQFAVLADYPEAKAFWWPRFVRIAHWFVGYERERRAGLAKLHAEIDGKIDIAVGTGMFRLTARADRIEKLKDGSYAILDYKTGQPPTAKQVSTGLSPQLTLEAAILRGGGFPGIVARASVSELAYVRLSGGQKAGEPKPIEFKDGATPDSHADLALKRLTEVVSKFALEAQAYHSLVHPMWKTRYGDYDHLARVKEWSLGGGDGDSE